MKSKNEILPWQIFRTLKCTNGLRFFFCFIFFFLFLCFSFFFLFSIFSILYIFFFKKKRESLPWSTFRTHSHCPVSFFLFCFLFFYLFLLFLCASLFSIFFVSYIFFFQKKGNLTLVKLFELFGISFRNRLFSISLLLLFWFSFFYFLCLSLCSKRTKKCNFTLIKFFELHSHCFNTVSISFRNHF